MANIVEVVLQAKDQASGVIDQTSKSLSGLETQSAGTGGALGKLAIGAAAVFAAFKSLSFVVDQIEEAQAAAAQLDSAFNATGSTLGKTRESLDDLATEIQRTTTYNDELVKSAEAILLTFDNVRGQAFDRTIKAAADLGARLGTDLPSAVRMLGRALQEPEQGLSALRRAGVTFSDEQVRMAKQLVLTGRAAEAQDMILGELERRFGGAAVAARNTLGGALTGLKNAFGDLFEGTTQGTDGAVGAVNGLTTALENPKLKSAIDSLISGLATIVEKILEVSTGILGIFSKGIESERQKLEREIKEFEALLAPKSRGGRAGIQQTSPDDIVMGGGARGITRSALEKTVESLKTKLAALPEAFDATKTSAEGAAKAVVELDDGLQYYNVTARKIVDTNPWIQFYEDFNAINNQTNEDFQDLFNNFSKFADEAFKGVPTDFKASSSKTLEMQQELSEAMKGIWQGVGQSIQSSLADAFYNGSLSISSFMDILRRAVAEIASAAILGKLKEVFTTMSDSSGGGDSSSGWGAVFSGLVKAFSAGGGRTDGPTVVGESGPEVVVPSGSGMRTFNARQLAFAGGGGSVNFAPSYNIGIQGARNDDEIYQNVVKFVNQKSSRDQQEFMRTLERNGYGRLR